MASSERTIERARLLARLAAERADLLEQLIGRDERTLTESLIFGDWTVKDLLAHIAAWDRMAASGQSSWQQSSNGCIRRR
jgi:hypothetical protein